MAKTLRDRVASSTDFAEFLADHFNGTMGHILIKASPLLAPLPSAIAIYTALHIKFHWFPALIATIVVEGLGFAAVDAKNKIEESNRKGKTQADTQGARRAVAMYFIVTLVTILGFETFPAWATWINQTVEGYTFVDVLSHTAPLVFPFFANIGASIYSLMDALNAIEQSDAEDANKEHSRLLKQIEDLRTKLSEQRRSYDEQVIDLQAENTRLQTGLNTVSKQYETERSKVSETEQQLAIETARAKMLQERIDEKDESLERFQDTVLIGNGVSNTVSKRPNKRSKTATFERRIRVLDFWKQTGECSLKDAEDHLGIAKSTINNDLNWFANKHVIKRERNEATGLTIVTVNGKEEAFRNGEL